MSSLRSRATHPVTGLAVLAVVATSVVGCARPDQLGYEGAVAPRPPEPVAPAPAVPGDPALPDAPAPAPGDPVTPDGPAAAPDDPAAAPDDPAAAPDDPAAAPDDPALPGVPVPPVAAAGSDVQASLDRPVEISTPGPAELLVRTEVLQPGQESGWVRHPGTVVSAVRSGTVTVQRAGRCGPEDFGPGQAFFLGDGEPNLLRNDGAEPVVLTRSELLAPGAPEREPAEPAC